MSCPICDQKPANCDCTALERRMHSEIEELEDAIPRWIAVEASLPAATCRGGESSDDVLVSLPFDDGSAMLSIGYYSHQHKSWQVINASRRWTPTHWMPLPKPPWSHS